MEEKKIVTIDLGTDKLGFSVATLDDNRNIALTYYNEFESDGIKHSKLSNPTRLAAKIKEAVSLVEQTAKISISEVMVNTQRYGVREIDHTIEASTSNGLVCTSDLELMDSVVWGNRDIIAQDEEIIACIPQSYDLDNGEYNVCPEDAVGMVSDHITGRYKVYALKHTSVDIIEHAFKDSGIIVRKCFAPDLVGRGILSENEKNGGVALIDLGAGASSVSIFTGGVLRHYYAIPFGGCNITYDIANVCGISEELAENIKLAFGGCMPDRLGSLGDKKLRITSTLDKSRREISVKYLSEIITAREQEIIETLLYEIQTSGYADKLKNGIILTGGASAMLNICLYIKELSGYNAKVAAASRNIFRSEDSSFFTLGASNSCGMLLKYAETETVGCKEVETQPEKAQSPKTEETEPVNTNGELFGTDETTTGEELPKKDAKKVGLGSLFGIGSKTKKQPKPEKKEEEGAVIADLFGFGEDEEA